MNSPVDCKSFFEDQIKRNNKGVWCVTLRPDGRILSLFEARMDSLREKKQSFKTLISLLAEPGVKQYVIAHINPDSPFFTEEDWRLLDELKQISDFCEIPLCDYLKIKDRAACSLLQFEDY